MPYIPPKPKPAQVKTNIPTPINSRPPGAMRIKEKPLSIRSWHVDPRRISLDLGWK